MSHRTARRLPTRRLATVGGVAAATAGLVASAGLVWHSSYSAFSSQTTTPANNWTAGTVSLTNDKTASVLWNVAAMKPGQTGSQCVTVTSSGNLPSLVKMYTTSGTYTSSANTNTASLSFGSYMNLTIQQGTGSCASFTADSTGGNVYTGATSAANLKDFSTNKTNYSNGAGSWTTTGGANETKIYKFTYTFDLSALSQANTDGFQAGTAAIGFTWEAQNT